jgi:hypothetical protein
MAFLGKVRLPARWRRWATDPPARSTPGAAHASATSVAAEAEPAQDRETSDEPCIPPLTGLVALIFSLLLLATALLIEGPVATLGRPYLIGNFLNLTKSECYGKVSFRISSIGGRLWTPLQ